MSPVVVVFLVLSVASVILTSPLTVYALAHGKHLKNPLSPGEQS
jgi:hypothetical protein